MFNRIPTSLAYVVIAVALALAGYQAWTYSGLYRGLAELQLGMFDEYFVQLTFLVTALISVASPLLGLTLVFGRGTPGTPVEGPRWMEAHPRATGFLFAGVAGVSFGGWNLVGVWGLDEPVPVAVEEIVAGRAPRWVHLADVHPDWEAALTHEDNRVENVYVPLLVGAEGPPFAVFAKGEDLDAGFDAMVSRNGLPGVVRAGFEEAGLVGADHWLVDSRDSPGKRRGLGWVMLGFGALASIGGGAVLWYRR